MTSPSLELQGAIVARLRADADVKDIAKGVHERIPENASFPYVSMGPSQALSEDADCIIGFEITMQIDAWSRAFGFPEVSRLAEAVRAALHDVDLQLTDNALVYLRHRQTRIFRDPDGLTNHAAIEFVALVEQP